MTLASSGAVGSYRRNWIAGATGATGPATGPAGPAGLDWGLLVLRGAQGPAGPAANGSGLVYMGGYASGTNYAVNDVVTYQGSSISRWSRGILGIRRR